VGMNEKARPASVIDPRRFMTQRRSICVSRHMHATISSSTGFFTSFLPRRHGDLFSIQLGGPHRYLLDLVVTLLFTQSQNDRDAPNFRTKFRTTGRLAVYPVSSFSHRRMLMLMLALMLPTRKFCPPEGSPLPLPLFLLCRLT
jgi:hypothetical protein